MATFDFISGDDFRMSLESDYRELSSAMETKSWKSAHVLAGSIIEAILVDYLAATDYQAKKKKDPLKMELHELITACHQEGILSQRAADLSSVVRGYRNLIHPGRVVRLQEQVDENGATVARSLVEIIVGEVARRREQKFGYTAEQITSKITQDSSTAAMMKHLLKDMHPHELERLLLTVLPKPYMDYVLRYDQERDSALDALPTCFRIAFDSASDEIKTQVARNFVRIVKEESGDYIRAYETAFFRGTDLAHLAQDEVNLVVDHILRRLQTGWALDADDYEKMIYGLGRFVPESEVYNFFEAIVTFVTRELLDDEQGVPGYYIFYIYGEYQDLPESSRLRFSRLLAGRIRRYRAQGQSREEQALKKLESQLGPVPVDEANTSDVSPDDVPF